MNETSSDFENIVIEKIPLIDVRAPIEFRKGAFKNTVNLPLMNDEERHLVGICYKEKGNKEAVKLGNQLVAGKIREARINAWVSHLEKYPNSLIYCFRGGQRSQISQEWIYKKTGKVITRLEGGYKAFRNYLLNALEPSEQKSTPLLLGGNTGSGKTLLLKQLDNSIDLEGIAHHRGSAFGKHVTPQPTQINFENNLAYALVQHNHKAYRYLILEDESSFIGRCFLPKPLFNYFTSSNLILIEIPFAERVNNILNEYVIQAQDIYMQTFGEKQGQLYWYNNLIGNINKLKKRLGGELLKELISSLELAFKEQQQTGNYFGHKNWITILLKEYYDPLYQYQLQNNNRKILFKGDTAEILEFFKTRYITKF